MNLILVLIVGGLIGWAVYRAVEMSGEEPAA